MNVATGSQPGHEPVAQSIAASAAEDKAKSEHRTAWSSSPNTGWAAASKGLRGTPDTHRLKLVDFTTELSLDTTVHLRPLDLLPQPENEACLVLQVDGARSGSSPGQAKPGNEGRA